MWVGNEKAADFFPDKETPLWIYEHFVKDKKLTWTSRLDEQILRGVSNTQSVRAWIEVQIEERDRRFGFLLEKLYTKSRQKI